MTRRAFLGGAASLALAAQPKRPNILWITCEDMSPNIGCFGDAFAKTPLLDALAAKGLRYRSCWSNAPVCAPARTTIISGMYAPAMGAEHMRSLVNMGPGRKMFPQLLREAGYYTSNNSKEDYNLELTGKVWDESGPRAHWRKRPPGQPFFSVFNFLGTHESQIRTRPHEWKHSFEGVRVPAYHPDTPEVRQDWAQYYDNIESMDAWAGRILKELSDDGLTGDTIVFFFSDHGSGMPRSKRWPYDSGLRVPLILSIPETFSAFRPPEYKTGAETRRPVSFVDLAPTVLRLAGAAPPPYHQGIDFTAGKAREYVFGFRGRMDERVDMVRSAFDGRYVYIRNYMPHKIYGQHIAYMFETPTTRVWKELYDAGKLNAVQKRFWERKPFEELYDVSRDRDEIDNLAGKEKAIIARMRKALDNWLITSGDKGFLPEAELHGDVSDYDVAKVKGMADRAASMEGPPPADGLKSDSSAVRYWAALGYIMRGKSPGLLAADPSPSVRAIAAEAAGCFGGPDEARAAAETLLDLGDASKHGVYVAILALNGLAAMGTRAPADIRPKIKDLPDGPPGRAAGYVSNLKKGIM
ncbi:MAG: sulfatase [Acidobacteria bacterium]|nr:sulfatase [Acidobacteriota bacterium]